LAWKGKILSDRWFLLLVFEVCYVVPEGFDFSGSCPGRVIEAIVGYDPRMLVG